MKLVIDIYKHDLEKFLNKDIGTFCLVDYTIRDVLTDAKPYKAKSKGEWVRFKHDNQPEHIKCSKCGQYWSIADHDKTFKYCFNCGRKMTARGIKNETNN